MHIFIKKNDFAPKYLPGRSDGKDSACQCGRLGFNPWVGKKRWRREWLHTPAFLPRDGVGVRENVPK